MSLVSWAGSGMIHWKWESPVKCSIGERASGWRRRDLEKKRIRARDGLAFGIELKVVYYNVRFLNCRFICLLRMWNKLDGVVMYEICILQS